MAGDKRNQETDRERLTEAFWSLYQNKRIEEISAEDVAGKAGCGSSSFAACFHCVGDILEELERGILPREAAGELTCTFPAAGGSPSADGDMDMRIGAILEVFDRQSRYYRVLLGPHGDRGFAPKLKDAIKENISAIMPEAGTARFDYPLDSMVAALIGTMSYWYGRGQDYPREDLAGLISQFCSQVKKTSRLPQTLSPVSDSKSENDALREGHEEKEAVGRS